MYQKTTIVGRLGDDARQTTYSGQDCTQLSVAVDLGYYDNNNQWVDRTNWYRCSIWRTVRSERLKKGAIVLVSGSLQANLYRRNDGSQAISLDIKVDEFRVLVKAAGDSSTAEQQQAQQPPAAAAQQAAAENAPQQSGSDIF